VNFQNIQNITNCEKTQGYLHQIGGTETIEDAESVYEQEV